jgi:amidase
VVWWGSNQEGSVPRDVGPTDWYGLAENGVLASTVSDAALLLAVMADRSDLREPTPPDTPLRIAVSTKAPLASTSVDREFKQATLGVGEALAAAGHQVDEEDPPYSTKVGLTAIARWCGGVHDDAVLLGPPNLERRNRRHASIGRLMKAFGWVGPKGRERWRAKLRPLFERFDVLVTPTLAAPPIEAIEWGKRSWFSNVNSNARYAPFPASWNLADYPAAAIPAGMHSTGVPLSIQLVAPAGKEALLLSVASQIEELRPWPRHAPMADRLH